MEKKGRNGYWGADFGKNTKIITTSEKENKNMTYFSTNVGNKVTVVL